MKQSNRLIRQFGARALAGTLGAFLFVCSASGASPSQQVAMERLEQARGSYAEAKRSPLVESYAMKQLLAAEKTLNEAEAARKKANDPNPVTQSQGYSSAEQDAIYDDAARLAYIANRQSQGAVSYAEGVAATTDKLRLGQERAEVQLLKSGIEKKRLQRDVAETNGALERSRRELSLASSEAERARIMADIQAKEALLAKAQGAAKDREAEEARRDAEQARLRANASADDAQRAKAELAQLLKELSELQGQLTDRGIVLTVGDVLFATAKADLNASAQSSMDKIAAFLSKNPKRNLLVEGHTDSVGSDAYNQGLSEQRAASVKSALVRLNVASERIVTVGYGKRFPVSSNNPESGRQQNRRVDVVILNEGVKPESQYRK